MSNPRICLPFPRWGLIICLLLCGCPSNSDQATVGNDTQDSPDTIKANGPLRVLVLDDEELAKYLQRDWQASSEFDVEVRNESIASFSTKDKA